MSHISQLLANTPISSISVFAVILTLIRLLLIRVPAAACRAFAEVVEAALIAVVLVYMVIQPFIMKTFYIPSGSMLPTLVDDDHIVVNKIAYRFEPPHDEDVVVFVAPPAAIEQAPEPDDPESGPTNYIKRLIGVPGDVIQVEHGYISIDGQAQTHELIRTAFGLSDRNTEHARIESNDLALFQNGAWTRYNADEVAKQFARPGAKVEFHPGVTIRNGLVLNEPYTAEDPEYDLKLFHGHSILFDPDGGGYRIDGEIPSLQQLNAFRDSRPDPVPPGFVFVMGDNRNDSNDSTRWGPLEESRLVGKASFIFWPLARARTID